MKDFIKKMGSLLVFAIVGAAVAGVIALVSGGTAALSWAGLGLGALSGSALCLVIGALQNLFGGGAGDSSTALAPTSGVESNSKPGNNPSPSSTPSPESTNSASQESQSYGPENGAGVTLETPTPTGGEEEKDTKKSKASSKNEEEGPSEKDTNKDAKKNKLKLKTPGTSM